MQNQIYIINKDIEMNCINKTTPSISLAKGIKDHNVLRGVLPKYHLQAHPSLGIGKYSVRRIYRNCILHTKQLNKL